MIQEVLTYMIVGAAVTAVVLKTLKKFRKKKSSKNICVEENGSSPKRCFDCPAECILKDASTTVIQSNSDLCKKTKTIELNPK